MILFGLELGVVGGYLYVRWEMNKQVMMCFIIGLNTFHNDVGNLECFVILWVNLIVLSIISLMPPSKHPKYYCFMSY